MLVNSDRELAVVLTHTHTLAPAARVWGLHRHDLRTIVCGAKCMSAVTAREASHEAHMNSTGHRSPNQGSAGLGHCLGQHADNLHAARLGLDERGHNSGVLTALAAAVGACPSHAIIAIAMSLGVART